MPKRSWIDENSRALQKYPIGRRVRYMGEAFGHVVGHVVVGDFVEIVYKRNAQNYRFAPRDPKFTPAPGPLATVPEKDQVFPTKVLRSRLLEAWRELPDYFDNDEFAFLVRFCRAFANDKHKPS